MYNSVSRVSRTRMSTPFRANVGEANSQHFSTFFSLDLKVYREFQRGSLPLVGRSGRFENRRLRFGVYSINLTNHSNALDVSSSD